jgi:hypothetical protein
MRLLQFPTCQKLLDVHAWVENHCQQGSILGTRSELKVNGRGNHTVAAISHISNSVLRMHSLLSDSQRWPFDVLADKLEKHQPVIKVE